MTTKASTEPSNRLLVGVLGHPNSGKSRTWNTLFGRRVKTGNRSRMLKVSPTECVEVFLVSGSFEERREYAGKVLKKQTCKIVLCSMQYTEDVRKTLDYLVKNQFLLYIQWLNPGYSDYTAGFDKLGLVNRILSVSSVLSVRNGKRNPKFRVEEIREFIDGWARPRDLIIRC